MVNGTIGRLYTIVKSHNIQKLYTFNGKWHFMDSSFVPCFHFVSTIKHRMIELWYIIQRRIVISFKARQLFHKTIRSSLFIVLICIFDFPWKIMCFRCYYEKNCDRLDVIMRFRLSYAKSPKYWVKAKTFLHDVLYIVIMT